MGIIYIFFSYNDMSVKIKKEYVSPTNGLKMQYKKKRSTDC